VAFFAREKQNKRRGEEETHAPNFINEHALFLSLFFYFSPLRFSRPLLFLPRRAAAIIIGGASHRLGGLE